jgi:hypothetical protein
MKLSTLFFNFEKALPLHPSRQLPISKPHHLRSTSPMVVAWNGRETPSALTGTSPFSHLKMGEENLDKIEKHVLVLM